MATRLILVRHGHSLAEADGIVGGPQGCRGLSAEGVRQAEALRERFAAADYSARVVALYTSVLPRAWETAELIAPALPCANSPTRLHDLSEIHEPALDGKPRTPRINGLRLDSTKPGSRGAESYETFFRRATQCLEAIVADNPGTTVVVATHAGVVRAAMSVFGKSPLGNGMFLDVDHASISEFVYGSPDARPFTWRLHRYNDAAHMEQWSEFYSSCHGNIAN